MAKRLSKKEFAKQKQAEMKETINDAMDKITTYTGSADDFVEYLDFMSNMYDYSPRNQMLLNSQYQAANGVAGKKQFEQMGFNVHENEKPLKVLAPVFKKYTIDENKKWIPLDRPNKEQKEKIESGEYQVKQKLSYYKFAEVYDIGQTDAKAEDYPKMFPNRPYTFDERDIKEKYPDLKNAIKRFAEKKDYQIIDDQTTERLGNAKGAYQLSTDNIYMRPHLSDGEYVSTLNHEIAHGQLHKNSALDTPTKELEAEMTAYVTNKHFGLDTSDKAISYMATWTKNLNTLDDKEKIKVVERVSQTSRTMISGIEEEYAKENDIHMKKEIENIELLKLGDMSFNFHNLKDNKLKDFTMLNEVDSLKINFKDGKEVDFYNNAEEKEKFNKLRSNGSSVNVNNLDIRVKDYVQFGLDKNSPLDIEEYQVHDSVVKHLQDRKEKKNNRQKNMEL